MYNKITQNKAYLLAFIVTLAVVVATSSNYIHHNDPIYAPMELHLYDKELLTDNPDIVAYDKYGVIPAKFIIYKFSAFLMKLGATYEQTRVLYATIGAILTALLMTVISWRLRLQHPVLCAVFMYMSLYNPFIPGTIGAYGLKVGIGISQTDVTILVGLLAFALCLPTFRPATTYDGGGGGQCKHWNLALVVSAVAFALHPQSGLWSFCAIAVLYIVDCIINKQLDKSIWKGFIFLVIAVLAVSLPPQLTNFNSHPKDIFEIITSLRQAFHYNPMHYAFTKGLHSFVRQSIILGLFVVLFWLWIGSSVSAKRVRLTAVVFATSFFIALALNYLFTNILGSLFLTMLFISKYLPYPFLLMRILFVNYFDDKLSRGNYIIALILWVIIFTARSKAALWCLPPLIAYEFAVKKGYIDEQSISARLFGYKHYFLGLGCLLATLWTIHEGMRPDRNLFLTTPTEILVRTEMTDDIYEIANKFRKLTSKNDRLLLDPYHKRRGMFSIISQRDVYLIGEEGPETYFGLYEKEKRVRKLGCVYEGDFAKKTPAEIVALLDEIAYKYVLVDNASEQFKSFSGLTPVIEQGTWTIFMRK